MRTDYTVIVTVEHPEGQRPDHATVASQVISGRPLMRDEYGRACVIDAEVIATRPWPENPSDPKSWVNPEPCVEAP